MTPAPLWPRLAALAVVLSPDRDAALLVRRRNPPDAGLWGYPGGHVEPGETVRAAAIRELAEETGLVAAPGAILTCLDVIRHNGTGRLEAHFALVAVLCQAEGDPAAASDAAEAAWIPAATILTDGLAMSDGVGMLLRLAQAASA